MRSFPHEVSRVSPANPLRSVASQSHQRRLWNERAPSWDHGGATGLDAVIEAVLAAADVQPGAMVVDLGCGTGSLSLPLARLGANVTAVDLSRRMVELLDEKAASVGLTNITSAVSAIEDLEFPPGSVDLVVSNYALHHLHDRDKQLAVQAAAKWLRPGGRVVIGDMMFGRGATAHDRAVIRSKVTVLLRKGPGGWWRVLKNAAKFSFRVTERPVATTTWARYLESAGLTDVTVQQVVAEAAVVAADKPSR